MKFEWFILNYDYNNKKTKSVNIFDEDYIQQQVEKAIKKYLRAPSKFEYLSYTPPGRENRNLYGFDALVREIASILRQEDADYFETHFFPSFPIDYDEPQPWGLYEQCEPNLVELTHSCIRQFKAQKQSKE